MAVNGINDFEKKNWRTEALSEVRKSMEEVEEEAPEVATWAREMAAVTNIADTVTYEMTGGNTTFTEELNNITNDNIALNELPASGQAVTPGAVQNPPEPEPEQANPELGPEDQVQPNVNTTVPEEEEVPEEGEPEPEFTPEEEQRMRDEAKALDPSLDVGAMSLNDLIKYLERMGITLEQ